MKKVIIGLYAALLLIGCTGNRADDAQNQDSVAVSAASDTDTLSIEAEMPPTAADGLFDDFMYSFMRSRSFQTERIKFPLTVKTDGKTTTISKEQWKFDRLYSRNDVYTMLFDDEKSVGREKDSNVVHVVVEWIYLEKGRVKQYIFDKHNGCWMMTGMDSHPLAESKNKDFYDFYRRFSTDEGFQQKHIENPFAFKTYDFDTYQELEGVLDVAQWADYRPELPQKVITNINYEQTYTDNGNRVFVITSPSAGMSCTLHFKKKQSGWMLVGLENI